MARQRVRVGLTAEQYFQHYAQVTDHGLEWSGPVNGKYGRMAHGGTREYAHRFSWKFFRGPVRESDIVDHIFPECPKTCITPGHLTVLPTRTEHMLAGWARGEYANTWTNRPRRVGPR